MVVVVGAAAALGFYILKPRLDGLSTEPAIAAGTDQLPPSTPVATPVAAQRAEEADSRFFPTEVVGRLVVSNRLPDEAWLEIDDNVYASGLGIRLPLRVSGDTTHRVSVHAAGYRSWAQDVYVPADSLVRIEVTLQSTGPPPQPPSPRAQTQTRDTRREAAESPTSTVAEPKPGAAQSRPGADPRPALPPEVRDSLVLRLEEGRILQEIGRYFEAAQEYQYVIDRVASAAVRFRGVGALDALRARADSGLIAVRLKCRSENQPRCP
jgi:hypothetical protein